jgi:nucleoside-diphosphate-sugar epimerase
MSKNKIVITGGAGLVGQNLVPRLKASGYSQIYVLDKHEINLGILQKMHPDVHCRLVDLAEPGDWSSDFEGTFAVVLLQAQIGGLNNDDFVKNNVNATELILQAAKNYGVARIIHVSSSVVESVANDSYTVTKRSQEHLVAASDISNVILRPTLMFGWFDRKHLGWLSRFMAKIPVFPVPGRGLYTRQPLYAGDFCRIIVRCIEDLDITGAFNISGQERITYKDLVREMKRATGSHAAIVSLPYPIFCGLLWLWSLFDRNPPFTTQQLKALVADDQFEVIDWPSIFDVVYTPLSLALEETFCHDEYSDVVLEF